jgi:glycosyltransferase involved in cell wall biosynthesis
LAKLFEACYVACASRKDIQFIFVNNGSIDDTEITLNQLLQEKKYSFGKLVHVEKNQGYGYGILQGLKEAEGKIIAWTHADLQTDPADVVMAFNEYRFDLENNLCIIKGERQGRNIFDNLFTAGMSFISTIFLSQKLWDINAQPKIFHKDFMQNLKNAPYDFSLDLYVLFVANKLKIPIKNYPVFFSKRKFGVAKGGGSLIGKYKLIKRTFTYIIELRKDILKGKR